MKYDIFNLKLEHKMKKCDHDQKISLNPDPANYDTLYTILELEVPPTFTGL